LQFKIHNKITDLIVANAKMSFHLSFCQYSAISITSWEKLYAVLIQKLSQKLLPFNRVTISSLLENH